MMINSVFRNSIGLGLFAVFTAGLIAVTQFSTADRILDNERVFRAKLLFEVLPQADEQLANALPLTADQGWQRFELLSLKGDQQFYRASNGDLILPVVAPDGYTEAIALLVGINRQQEVTGVRVVTHKETPGLGDKIETKKSPWVLQFDGKSLTVPDLTGWQVKKDGGEFDQLTGATITPRAIVKAVYQALEFYRLNQQQLLTLAEANHG